MGLQGGTLAFRKRAVRECLDTVAVLRAYREPLPDEVWTVPLASERRMLAQVNAILALGQPALRQVVDLAIDADLPDPGRVFAALLTLGCVAGPAWQQPMLGVFVAAVQRNAAEGAAAVEALSLAPNVELLQGLVTMLSDDRPPVRAAVVRVLSYRATLDESDWIAAMGDDDSAVVAAAAGAPLGGYDREECKRALEPLFHTRSERLVRSALCAGLSLRLRSAHLKASEVAYDDPTWADALQYLAMFGVGSDDSLIRAALAGSEWLSGVRAAALSGRVALVPDLLALKAQGEFPLMHRAEVKQALASITGLPFGAAEDDAAANLLWARNSSRFDLGQRYRNGLRFHPAVLLQSLQLSASLAGGPRMHMREARQQSYLELVSATGWRVPRFSAYDFVAGQSAALHRIGHFIANSVESHWAAGPLH